MPRPRSPLLSVDAIVSAALSLVDSTGDFSFPRMARELGVSQAALYNYIDNREHIIELMRGRIFSDRTHLVTDNLPWEEALRALAREYRARLVGHPRLVPLLVTQTIQDLAVMGFYEDMATVLGNAGLDVSAIVPAITTVDYLALGSALDLTAPDDAWSAPDDRFPALSLAAAHLKTREERAEAAFEFGLEVLVRGVQQAVARADF